jgi:hypothetical protein
MCVPEEMLMERVIGLFLAMLIFPDYNVQPGIALRVQYFGLWVRGQGGWFDW